MVAPPVAPVPKLVALHFFIPSFQTTLNPKPQPSSPMRAEGNLLMHGCICLNSQPLVPMILEILNDVVQGGNFPRHKLMQGA